MYLFNIICIMVTPYFTTIIVVAIQDLNIEIIVPFFKYNWQWDSTSIYWCLSFQLIITQLILITVGLGLVWDLVNRKTTSTVAVVIAIKVMILFEIHRNWIFWYLRITWSCLFFCFVFFFKLRRLVVNKLP